MDRKCHRVDCTSGARWMTELHLECPMPGGAKHLLKFKCAIEVCDAHREDVRPWVLSEENKDRVTMGVMDAGYHEPDFLTARIEFLPIEGRDIAVLQGCCREGCSRIAKYRIKRKFFAIGRRDMALEAMTNLWVCEDHKRITKAADLLMGDDRPRTFEWLQAQGILMPDLDRSELEFVPAPAMVLKS